MTTPGKFITFEGPEGGGKSTQLRRLAAALEQAGRRIVCTREPGGTPAGEAIRDILQHDKAGGPICPAAEALLFAASRAQLVRQVIRPALARGDWVLCDRFADSTTAYQGYGRGLPLAQVLAINAFALDGTLPDLTILLDLPVGDGLARLARRAGGAKDRIEREALAFHERVRNGYLELARRWPERFRVVSAAADADAVAAAVWKLVHDAFG